jgi:CheY-like chemotaxis protein
MPLVDGLGSTKLIRAFESGFLPRLSKYAQAHGRVPIFAVSASLQESLRHEYMACGFDAWIPKPIDILRLDMLIRGVYDERVRAEVEYRAGEWDSGGWFQRTGPLNSV